MRWSMTRVEFGERVEKIRKTLGLTQIELEHQCALNEGYLSHIENGHKNPSLETLNKIADGLGISLSELLKEDAFEYSELDADICLIIHNAKKLTHESRRDIVEIIKMFFKKQGEKNSKK